LCPCWTTETNEDTTSSSSGHQHPKERRSKRSPYMEGDGMNLNMIAPQEDPILGLYEPIYMTLMETVSPQKMKQSKNYQMKNQQHCDQH
jgi:hypothetical protein